MVTFLLRVGEMGLKRAVIKRGSLRAKPGTLHLNKVLRQILRVKRRQRGSRTTRQNRFSPSTISVVLYLWVANPLGVK